MLWDLMNAWARGILSRWAPQSDSKQLPGNSLDDERACVSCLAL